MEDKQLVRVRVRVRRKKRKSKKRYVLAGILLFLFLASSVSSVVGYPMYNTYTARYHKDLSLAQTGMQHLQKAGALLAAWPQQPLDVQLTSQAKLEFASALNTFNALNGDLQSLPGYARQVPGYGAKLSAALHIVPLAITLSRAGVASSDILHTLVTGLHDPLTPQGHGITGSDLAVVAQDVKELRSALVLATLEVNQFQPGDVQFDPRISKLVGTLHKDVPMIQGWLDTIEQFLPVAPTLLGVGTSTNYLIEVLDSTELRPGGGFIGNYGIATFSGGRLSAAHITDVYLLDKPFEFAGNTIPYPAAYTWFDRAPGSWSFRDSNLDADFPTAARYGELTYMQEGGNIPVQGVIAITPALIQHALAITGPINVPEYHEIVTSQNVIALIHYHQLGPAGEGSSYISSPDGHSSQRKRFTALLTDHFLARVRQLSSSALPKFLQLMVSSMHSKNLQVYLNSPIAEDLLQRYHLDAAIRSSTGDGLFVVDANISPNKANNFIVNKLDDQLTIDAEGNATHYTTISYAWIIGGQYYGSAVYRDYIRVYVPPGSILSMQDGWQPRGSGKAFGHRVWAGFFTLAYGQTRTITLRWTVPVAARKDAHGWHYQYEIQRQAGAQWTLHLQITLPPCAVMTNTWGGLVSSSRKTAMLTQSLNEDTNVGIDYTC